MKPALLFYALLPALFGLTLSASPSKAAEDLTQVKLDEIEFSGVTQFTQSSIESTLQIGPGDRLERVKVIKTAENLQTLYRNSGYEQTSIRSRLYRRKTSDGPVAVLAFDVVEGLPTRIAEIRFVGDLRNENQEEHWAKIKTYFLPKIPIKPTDILSQDQISNSKRLVQELLASEEFVGGQISDVTVTETSNIPKSYSAFKAAKWVTLEFRIDLGDRVTFGFRGNEVFPATQLLALIEEQRLLGLGKDYIGSIRAQIENLYKSIGYARVQIKTYTFEKTNPQERHVTYVIDEGPRVILKTIQFDGNSTFTSEELNAQFFKKAPQLTQRGYYVLDEVQKSAELVIEWLKSKGYLASKLVTITPTYKKTDEISLVLYVFEGEQTTVQKIKITGNAVFNETEIQNLVKIHEGQPLNLFSLSERLEYLKALYRSRGYLHMKITNEKTAQLVLYSSDNRFAEIHLDIEEGPQFRLSKIEIDGSHSTKPDVVLREIGVNEGETLGEQHILDAETRLRKLGIFSIANIRAQDDPEKPGFKLLKVSLQESTPGVLAWGLGFRNDIGARVFAQASWANIGGRNHTLSLSGAINRRIEDFRFIEGQAQLAYIWPWFSGVKELTFRPAFTWSANRYLKFSATTVSFTSTFDKPILKRPNITAGLTYSLEKIHQFIDLDKGDDPLEAADFQLGSITPGIQIDMRDNPLSPRSGFFSTASFEIANPLFFAQTDPYPMGYTRFLLRSDFYQPLPLDMIFYFSFRGGFERSTEKFNGRDKQSGAIPTIKTFTLGGPSSLRGFKEQQLNLYSIAVRGSAAYVNYRSQLDFPISGGLHMGPFLDAASLFTDPFADPEFSPDRVQFEWRYGAGMGFHYQTPVGPVNLDWGFNLQPKVGEDIWRFHFSIGVI